MSNISPIFTISNSQHFSDYGFDPQLHYFQVMEEARKHKRETSSKSYMSGLQFKIQKPISKDNPTRSTMHNDKKKKRCWWKKALPFFKWRKWPISTVGVNEDRRARNFRKKKKRCWWKKALPFFKWRKWPISTVGVNEDRRARNFRTVTGSMSMSGPIYATESLSGSSTPYRTTTKNRPSSGPIAGTLTPVRKGDVANPYLSLRELNMEQPQRISISSSPIYLVT